MTTKNALDEQEANAVEAHAKYEQLLLFLDIGS